MSKNPAFVMKSLPREGGIVPIPKSTYDRLMAIDVKLTRQGVRDLNGPRMDGKGHNGHPASCSHANTLPFDEIRMVAIYSELGEPAGERARIVRVHRCAFCNVELSNSKER